MASGFHFRYDERLGIPLPVMEREWEEFSEAEQAQILLLWEQIRGSIPDRVKHFEEHIKLKLEQLNQEEDFAASCRLNADIAELASRINDLHIWYRVNQTIADRRSHT